MKLVKLTVIFAVIALIAVSCGRKEMAQKKGSNTIAGILQNAKCPLSEDQEKRLKEIKPGGGREAFRGIYDIFDDKQLNALKAVFGSSPGRDGGPERPRFLFFAVMFENAGCPMSEAQLQAMKELPQGREGFEKMREVFNEKQSEVLQGMFNR